MLTFYRPLPTDHGPALLLDPSAHRRFLHDAWEAAAEILPVLGLTTEVIDEVRLARFGHALPLAAPGLHVDGTLAAARAPLPGVWFVNQDDWAYPAVETCLLRALEVEHDVRRALGKAR